MPPKPLSKREPLSILYDILFGLVLFFSLDSFLEIRDPAHFVFYLFTTVVLVHWWLMFKSAADIFVKGLRESAVHIVANIASILLLELMILHAQEFEAAQAVWYLVAVLLLDMLWAWMVLAAGRWHGADAWHVRLMKAELRHIIRIDASTAALLGVLAVCVPILTPSWTVGFFVAIYGLFIALSFRYKIIDFDVI